MTERFFMSIMKQVVKKINQLPSGTLVTLGDFHPLDVNSSQALSKSLSRLAKEGEIKRLSKGRYYKPKKTRFGEGGPGEAAIIDCYTKNKGKLFAYKTGLAAYYEMGLTTQIPNEIVLASTQSRRKLTPIRSVRIRTVKASVRPEAWNIKLLQLLDAIRDFKKIPATTPDESIRRLIVLLAKLQTEDLRNLIGLSENYSPATRAALGAMLDSFGINTETIKKSLNGLTKYNLGISDKVLPNKKNWNIR